MIIQWHTCTITLVVASYVSLLLFWPANTGFVYFNVCNCLILFNDTLTQPHPKNSSPRLQTQACLSPNKFPMIALVRTISSPHLPVKINWWFVRRRVHQISLLFIAVVGVVFPSQFVTHILMIWAVRNAADMIWRTHETLHMSPKVLAPGSCLVRSRNVYLNFSGRCDHTTSPAKSL